MRPIGIGEAARRIIAAKAILHITREDIQQAAGSLQLCAGQMAGAEAAIHGMNLAFHDQGSDAVLLVDAINAFNLINRHNFITSDIYALPWQQSSSTPIMSPQISLSMAIPFFLRREQL